jgi:hypothetical protein
MKFDTFFHGLLKMSHTLGTYALRVGITLERVEVTLVSVIFARIRVILTLVCLESTLCL